MNPAVVLARSGVPLLLAAALSAQTFVVDAGNGPGTDYTSLAAATAAVPTGSTLRIRAGSFEGFVIDAKGVTLLADAGVVVSQTAAGGPAIDIASLAAGQDVVIDEVLGGELHLLGTSRVQGAYSSLTGTGSVWVDAGVTISQIVAPGVTVVMRPTSSLRTTFTGTHAEATLTAPNGWFGAIAVSVPGPRVQVPGMDDEVWLDGGSLQFVAQGLTGPGTPVVASLPYTPGALVGYPSMWQGVTYDPVDGLQVSNPSVLILR